MAINVTPIPGLDPEINDIRRRTADFINPRSCPTRRSSGGPGGAAT